MQIKLGPFEYDTAEEEKLYGKRELREKVSIADEGIYIGEWLVGSTVRQGRGIMIYKERSIYEGYWLNN